MALYLKIIDNPLEANSAKVIEVPFVYCKKLVDILEEYNMHDRKVFYGGKEIDVRTHHIIDNSVFLVLPRIGVELALAIASVIASIAPYLAVASFGYAIYSYVANQPKHLKNVPNVPTYGWDGIHTSEQIGIPVAVIYGEHKFGGNRINQYVSGSVSNGVPVLLNSEESGYWYDWGYPLYDRPRYEWIPNPNYVPRYSFDSNKFWKLDADGDRTNVSNASYVNSFTTPDCYGIQFSVISKRMRLEYDGGSDVRTAQQLFYNCRGVADTGGDEYARFIIRYRAVDGLPGTPWIQLHESLEQGMVVITDLAKAKYDIQVELDARNCIGFDSSDFYVSDLKYYVDEGIPPAVSDQDQYYNCLIGLCEGEIDSVTQPEVAGEPLGNKMTGDRNLLYFTRLGTTDQLPITGFNELHDLGSVKGDYFGNLNDTQIYTTDGEVDAYEIHLIWPSGLYYIHRSGEIESGWSQYKVEHKRNGDSSWITVGTYDQIACTYSAVRKILRVDVATRDVYDIRITRLRQDDFPPRYQSGFRVDYIDEIIGRPLRYPNTALLGLRLLATKQLSGGAPDVSVMIRGRKVEQPVFWKQELSSVGTYPTLKIADTTFQLRTAAQAVAHTSAIDSVSGLQNMANNLDGNYYLTEDINAAGFDFQPVGNTTTPFTGTLDGNGFKILGLTVNQATSDCVGLFGCIKGTSIDTGLEDSYMTGDNAYRNVTNTGWSCQTFTASENYDAVKVALKCYRSGSPGTITVSIKATDVDGKPTGDDLCSGTIDGNALSTIASFVTITFTSAASLVSGAKYAICVRGSASLAYLRWRYASSGASYAGGSFGYSNDSGSSWTLNANYDFMFATYKAGDIVIGGIIEDVILEDCSVLGRSYVGSLVGKIDGYNSTSTPIVHNCHSSGVVTCNKDDTQAHSSFGGMIGYAISGSPAFTYVFIQDCVSSVVLDLADVQSSIECVGGFIGGSDGSVVITNCRATGNVSAYTEYDYEDYEYYDTENPYGDFSYRVGSYTGGFVGRSSSGTITDCAATGAVSGGVSSGGFVGKNSGCIFTRCSARGNVEGYGSGGGILI